MTRDQITRIKTRTVAERMDCSVETVRAWANEGYLTWWTPDGTRGKSHDLWFDAAEVEAFIRGGAPAAKAYRERLNGDVTPTRRGRGRKKVTA